MTKHTYTHVYIIHTHQMVPLADAPAAVLTLEAQIMGFLLVDADRIKIDQHGHLCRRAGGWSYGHIQGMKICAGAGGPNTSPVMRIAEEHDTLYDSSEAAHRAAHRLEAAFYFYHAKVRYSRILRGWVCEGFRG